MLYILEDNCGYRYPCNSLLHLYRQMLVIMERVDYELSQDFEVTSEPSTSTEQLAAIFADSPLRSAPRIELAEVPTKTTLGGMFAHLRKQAARKEMGIFQYLTWADCQANGDVMPAMVMLIHEDDFRQEKANDILPLDICTIEGIEDWAFAHNCKTDASWCVVPATWNGKQWTVAGVFTEQEWMTKAGWVPGPSNNAPRWMRSNCLRYSVHVSCYENPPKRGEHLATYYGQGNLLRDIDNWGSCDLFVERWNDSFKRFDPYVRTTIGGYLAAIERNAPVEDLITGAIRFC